LAEYNRMKVRQILMFFSQFHHYDSWRPDIFQWTIFSVKSWIRQLFMRFELIFCYDRLKMKF
jgi:hypothetical protein